MFCIAESTPIEYTICPPAECASTTAVNVTLTPTVEPPSAQPYITFGGVFMDGSEVVPVDPNCYTITLDVNISSAMPPGTNFQIIMQATPEELSCPKYLPDQVSVSGTAIPCEPPVCDCPANSIVIGFPGQTTLLTDVVAPNGPLPAMPVGQAVNLIVRGTLVMNTDEFTNGIQNYEFFSGSNLCFDEGAQMIVPNSGSLKIVGSHLQGCEKMWKGILVEGLGEISLLPGLNQYNHMLIEDAEHALLLEGLSSAHVMGTEFRDNYIGIYAMGSVFQPEAVIGSTFSSTGSLLPNYIGQLTFPNQRTRYGILLEKAGLFEIGAVGEDPNIFDGPVNGIVSDHTHIFLMNSEFRNFTGKFQYPEPRNYAVYAEGSGHEFWQNYSPLCATNSVCTFDNCRNGIYLHNMNCYVTGNNMTNMYTGIYVEECKSPHVEICHNSIGCIYRGITLRNNDNAAVVNVSNNAIDLDWNSGVVPKGRAIHVEENQIPHQSATIFNNQEINITNALSGIFVSNANGYDIGYNRVFADRDAASEGNAYTGFNIVNGLDIDMKCNLVDGDRENFPALNGNIYGPAAFRARFVNSLLPDINSYRCNDAFDTNIGWQFDMECDGTVFQGTEFQNNEFGLHYRMTAETGKQPENPLAQRHGNRWIGSWTSGFVGARLDNPTDDRISSNQYIVPSFTGNQYAPNQDPDPATTVVDWFDVKPGGFITCDNVCNELIADDEEGEVETTVRDQKIADGTYTFTVYAQATQWMAERQLYKKLRANPELRTADLVFEDFYNNKSNSNIGLMTDIEEGIQALFTLDPGTEAELSSYNDAINIKMEKIGELNGLIPSASSGELPALLDEKRQVKEELGNYTTTRTELMQTIQQARSNAADQIIADNAAITATEVYEVNEQTVNGIFLNTFAKGVAALDPEQVAILENIGVQCPYEGGPAVFRARGMVAPVTELDFEELEDCNTEGQYFIGPETGQPNQVSPMFSVFPNPAGDRFTVQLMEATHESAELWVTDIDGKLVKSYQLNEQERLFEFSSKGLGNGIYFLKLLEGNKEVSGGKLVIMK
ncbi:MAG: T9SS type A sorting domain-containing protein [Saprospiraceae bacterium]